MRYLLISRPRRHSVRKLCGRALSAALSSTPHTSALSTIDCLEAQQESAVVMPIAHSYRTLRRMKQIRHGPADDSNRDYRMEGQDNMEQFRASVRHDRIHVTTLAVSDKLSKYYLTCGVS